jgi:hypothetical protein
MLRVTCSIAILLLVSCAGLRQRHIHCREGSFISWLAREELQRRVPPFATIRMVDLTARQGKVIADLLGAPYLSPEFCHSFRWGPSLVPPGHPDYKTLWYRIEHPDETGFTLIRLSPGGEVLSILRRPKRSKFGVIRPIFWWVESH